MNSPEPIDWKKNLKDNFFYGTLESAQVELGDIESFISSLLASQRRQVIEEAAHELEIQYANNDLLSISQLADKIRALNNAEEKS